jgi:hypothetical protein
MLSAEVEPKKKGLSQLPISVRKCLKQKLEELALEVPAASIAEVSAILEKRKSLKIWQDVAGDFY